MGNKYLLFSFRNLLFLALSIIVFNQNVLAQEEDLDDLMNILETEAEPEINYAFATFKSTRLVSGHSSETNAEGVMQFLIGHRFGRLNAGWRDLFGLDVATIRLGFEYGITDDLNIGIGRSSFTKIYDGFVKYRFLKQKSGAKKFPFTATGLASVNITSERWRDPNRDNLFSSRVFYAYQLMISRKFNEWVSLQLTPTVIHRNLVATRADQNTIFSMGFGSSVKLTSSLRLNMEYYWVIPSQIESSIAGEKVQDSFSIGVDLETGGHVFQLHFTNSRGMIEKFIASETTGRWLNGDIHFGFNVSRVFTIYDRNKKAEKRAIKKAEKS